MHDVDVRNGLITPVSQLTVSPFVRLFTVLRASNSTAVFPRTFLRSHTISHAQMKLQVTAQKAKSVHRGSAHASFAM